MNWFSAVIYAVHIWIVNLYELRKNKLNDNEWLDSKLKCDNLLNKAKTGATRQEIIS
jgi:hypothetical protein